MGAAIASALAPAKNAAANPGVRPHRGKTGREGELRQAAARAGLEKAVLRGRGQRRGAACCAVSFTGNVRTRQMHGDGKIGGPGAGGGAVEERGDYQQVRNFFGGRKRSEVRCGDGRPTL